MRGGRRWSRLLLIGAVWLGAGARAGTSNDPVFVLEPSQAFAPPQLDLVQSGTLGGAPVCPLDGGSNWSCSWSSDTFAVGQALDGGPSSVALYPRNAGGLRGQGSNSASTKNLTVPVPAGVVANDVMIAAISYHGASAITAPSGWTLIQNTAVTFAEVSTYWKVASGSEPANYTWGFGSVAGAAGVILDYVGVDTAAPVMAVQQSSAVLTTSQTLPAVSTAGDNVRLVMVQAINSNTTMTVPADLTRQTALSSASLGFFVDDGVQWLAGTAGPWTTTTGGTADGVDQTIALTPSSTAPAICSLSVNLLDDATPIGSTTLPASSLNPGGVVTASFATSALAFTTGSRLHLQVSAPNDPGNCGAQLLFGSSTAPAQLVVPLGLATSGDSGTPDSGTPDSGTPDSGTPDAGTPDSGSPDGGASDAGTDGGSDGGHQMGPPRELRTGCGCGSGDGLAGFGLALWAWWTARARRRRSAVQS